MGDFNFDNEYEDKNIDPEYEDIWKVIHYIPFKNIFILLLT